MPFGVTTVTLFLPEILQIFQTPIIRFEMLLFLGAAPHYASSYSKCICFGLLWFDLQSSLIAIMGGTTVELSSMLKSYEEV